MLYSATLPIDLFTIMFRSSFTQSMKDKYEIFPDWMVIVSWTSELNFKMQVCLGFFFVM